MTKAASAFGETPASLFAESEGLRNQPAVRNETRREANHAPPKCLTRESGTAYRGDVRQRFYGACHHNRGCDVRSKVRGESFLKRFATAQFDPVSRVALLLGLGGTAQCGRLRLQCIFSSETARSTLARHDRRAEARPFTEHLRAPGGPDRGAFFYPGE